MNTRKVLCVIEVDDDKAIERDSGTIEYLEVELNKLNDSGIHLTDARILDDDDKCDANAIDAAEKIFNEEI